MAFSAAYWATLPEPEITTVLPSKLSPLVFNILSAKYTVPYPVASGRIFEPPQESPLPVSTPVNSLRIFLYIPNRNPISRAPTPISPAGTSVFGPMCLFNSNIKAWQKRITSSSDLPLGSKSDPPLPPPMGRVVKLFLNTCSKAKNLRILAFTVG